LQERLILVRHNKVIDQAYKQYEQPNRVEGGLDQMSESVEMLSRGVCKLQKKVCLIPRVPNKEVPVIFLNAIFSDLRELRGEL